MPITPRDNRATGQTTRRVDDYIQQLFARPGRDIVIYDHWEGGTHRQANKNLAERIDRRMRNEHPGHEVRVRWLGCTPILRLLTSVRFILPEPDDYLPEIEF